jgi:hypothetical protein
MIPLLSDAEIFIAAHVTALLALFDLILFALLIRNTAMLDTLKTILAKVQNELTAGLTAMGAALASVTAERDALKAELEALKASLGDLPQVETDLAAALDHALTLIPAPAA